MTQIKYALALFAATIATTSFAAPVEFDTPSAHVIVVRPAELWSGDRSRSEDIMESVRKRRVSYKLMTAEGGSYRGSPNFFQGVSDHPVTKGVEARLSGLNFKLASNDLYNFQVSPGIAVDPKDMTTVLQAQETMFKRMVVQQGDPTTLETRISTKKFLGGVASLAAIALSVDKFGATGGVAFSDSSGIADGIYRMSYQYKGALAPVSLPTVDFSSYKAIEMRTVKSGASDRIGQIIIAYKEGPTTEAQTDALIKAIVSVIGADTNAEEVEKARTIDLANRIAAWKNWCASSTEAACKVE